MAMKGLPMLCILFLLFNASLIFPSAEGTRTLQELKAGIGISITPVINPNRPVVSSPPGRPYTQVCRKGYYCPRTPPVPKP